MVLIISLKTLGLSYGKISHLLQMLFSLNLTESTINHAVSKTAQAFDKKYTEMIAELKKEFNIYGDETIWRVNGENYWLWAFVGKWTVIYEIDKSRGAVVPKRILKGYEELCFPILLYMFVLKTNHHSNYDSSLVLVQHQSSNCISLS